MSDWSLLVNGHNWNDFKNNGRQGWKVFGEPKSFPCLVRFSDCGIRALSAVFVYPEDVKKLNEVVYQGGDQFLSLIGNAAPVVEVLNEAKQLVESWDDTIGGLPGADKVLRALRVSRRIFIESSEQPTSVVVEREKLTITREQAPQLSGAGK